MKTSPLSGGRLKLSFEPVAPDLVHEVLRRDEAQAALTLFHTALLEERPRIQVLTPPWRHGSEEEEWEQRLRPGFESRFGLTLVPTARELEQSPLLRALKLSPRYMGEGVREAALEMFASPAFVVSIYLSMLVYFAAWMAPEPLFTKSFAAMMTAVLAVSVGMMELNRLALAYVRLYREA